MGLIATIIHTEDHMRRLFKPLFWSLLFLVILLAIDQFFVQVPPVNPAHAAVVAFYRDFRSRLIDEFFGETTREPPSIEAVIEQQQKDGDTPQSQRAAAADKNPSETSPSDTPRYLYVDAAGELHFADTLDDVPAAYRTEAQRMGGQ